MAEGTGKTRSGKPAPIALPPQGVEHHYAPLAVITVDANGKISVNEPVFRTRSSHWWS